ncbi:MAG: tetratricopeptide repeat protein, partial [Chthoniobacteraceae bacterium]
MKPNTKAFAIAVTLTLTPLVGIALAVLMKSGGESDKEVAGSLATSLPSPTKLILVPHTGDTALDRRIRDAQEAITAGHTPVGSLDRLGWLFVEKARVSSDPGFYKLAEQCALALDERSPGDFSAMLLRGHVLQNLHQFQQAEPLARKLVAGRGSPSDYGLLGDVLADLGRLDEAIAAYQSMMDLRPDSQAHARAAHVRWLKGDLTGATEAMRSAASAIGSRNAESAAWMNTRLAFFEFQSGDTSRAEAACASALECVTDFPPALLLRGRMQLAAGKATETVEDFRRAAKANPLPEYLWLLAESLRKAHREPEAIEVEAEMLSRRTADDPRTIALFLATRGEQT